MPFVTGTLNIFGQTSDSEFVGGSATNTTEVSGGTANVAASGVIDGSGRRLCVSRRIVVTPAHFFPTRR